MILDFTSPEKNMELYGVSFYPLDEYDELSHRCYVILFLAAYCILSLLIINTEKPSG